MLLDLIEIIGILIVYQSLVFVFTLFLNKSPKAFFSIVLLCICVVIIIHFGYMVLENYRIIDNLFLGPFFGLIYGPLYYVYSKSLIIESSRIEKFVLHFTPAFTALLLIILFGDQLMRNSILVSVLVILHFTAYLFMSLRLIYRYRKQLKNSSSSFYRISLFWLEIVIYIQLLTIVVLLFKSYFHTILNTDFFILIIYLLTLILIHCFYYLGLKQVRLFKGFKEELKNEIIPKGYSISNEVYADYVQRINTYIKDEKPYLEFDIALQDFSEKLSISPRNLSYVINNEFKKNYYGFINHYRLEVAKQSLIDSNRPIKEIMYDSGFSNKATFYSIFKKSTGVTPVQFRKNIRNLS